MSKLFLAFDIGGTTIKYGLVDSDMNISNRGKVSTENNQDGYILKKLKEITKQIQNTFEIDGIGVSTAGIVAKDGSIQYAGPTIPEYIGTPIKEELTRTASVPVSVVNDVDAALLGEVMNGAAKHCNNAYCVALGTGIGGAYLHNGHISDGSHGTGNSIGYILYDKETNTNYEQRAATLTLERNLEKYGISVKDAFEKAKNHDEKYETIIKDWSDKVAQGLAEVLLLFDPEVLLIGGAVSLQKDYLIDLLTESIKKYVPEGLVKTDLKVTTLANDAQLLGAISQIF